MKNKLLKWITCWSLIFILLMGALPLSAAEDPVDEAQGIINSIVVYQLNKTGAGSVQQWIDGALTEGAGVSSEWYAISLSQYGRYDFSSYQKSLSQYLAEHEEESAPSRQKYALALIATGSTDPYIYRTLHDSIGEKGLMSWIYGLHLLNNGYTGEKYSLAEVRSKLLSLQLSDGGWAVTGTNGDVDSTAMAIQALAPYYKSDAMAKNAIDQGLTLLSARQKENGDYASYGVNNPESTAQVLMALSTLGIDCETDSRFIKNGNTVLDGIRIYQLEDGSFCHKQDGSFSASATAQVFCGMVSYLRMQNGKTGFYILDARDPAGVENPATETEGQTSSPKKSGGYKLWVCLGLAVAAGMICAVLYLMKKRNVRNFIAVGVVAAAAILLVLLTDLQTADEHYSGVGSKENAIGTVTVSIRCDAVPDKSPAHIPDDGVLLEWTPWEIEEGDTVYDILLEITADRRIHLETSGGADAAYVEGIGNLYELDYGDLSGWVYHVNGEPSAVSCSDYLLSAGDEIEWLYTCNLGEDVK